MFESLTILDTEILHTKALSAFLHMKMCFFTSMLKMNSLVHLQKTVAVALWAL